MTEKSRIFLLEYNFGSNQMNGGGVMISAGTVSISIEL